MNKKETIIEYDFKELFWNFPCTKFLTFQSNFILLPKNAVVKKNRDVLRVLKCKSFFKTQLEPNQFYRNFGANQRPYYQKIRLRMGTHSFCFHSQVPDPFFHNLPSILYFS